MTTIIIDTIVIFLIILLIIFREIIYFRLYKSSIIFKSLHPDISSSVSYATLLGLPMVRFSIKYFNSIIINLFKDIVPIKPMAIIIILFVCIMIIVYILFNYKKKYEVIIMKYNKKKSKLYHIIDLFIIIYLIIIFSTLRL